MDRMQPRRHQDYGQPLFPLDRQTDIGMMEQNAHNEERLPIQVHLRCGTDQPDLSRSKRYRKSDFAKVKPERGRGVHLAINVVNSMKSPQQWYAVRHAMPHVKRV